MKKTILIGFSFALFIWMTTPMFAAISSEVKEVTTTSATVHWSSDRNDVDSYTVSVDGQAAMVISKGQPITVLGSRGSNHRIEIIGTTTIDGKIYYLEPSEGVAGVYYEMVQSGNGLVKAGPSISFEEMSITLVQYGVPGLGYYQEAVRQTVIMEKVTIDLTLLDAVMVSASSSQERYGVVNPEFAEVIVGERVSFTAVPTTLGTFVKWIEVTDSGYALADIGFTEVITLMPSKDMYIQAVFAERTTEVADTTTPNPDDQDPVPDDPDTDEEVDDSEIPQGPPENPTPPQNPDDGIQDDVDDEIIEEPDSLPEGVPQGVDDQDRPDNPEQPDEPDAVGDIEDDIDDDDIPGFLPSMPKTAGIFIGFFGIAAGGFIILGILARKRSE